MYWAEQYFNARALPRVMYFCVKFQLLIAAIKSLNFTQKYITL